VRLDFSYPHISPAELYELLRRNNLLPQGIGNIALLAQIKSLAERGVYLLVVDDTGVLASTLTMRQDPGTLAFYWIPEVKALHTRRDDLIDLSASLRELWFTEGIKRVEARVAASRRQTFKALITMGFKNETANGGLRNAVNYGNGDEMMHILGLLPTDKPLEKRKILEEVANG